MYRTAAQRERAENIERAARTESPVTSERAAFRESTDEQERCSGSGLAIGYTPSSGLAPAVMVGPKVLCPACLLKVSTTSDYVNVRLVEHSRASYTSLQ